MAINFRGMPRTASPIVAAIALLWAVSFGAVRQFVWADLRAGLIDLRGLPWTTRVLIWLGFASLLAMAAGLLFNDLWRSESPLLARTSGTPGRGALLPVALVPATLFLLAMAWSFALTGALHSHPTIRLAVLVLYLLWAASWTGLNLASEWATGGWTLWLGPGALAAVPFLSGLRWRAQPRPIVLFSILLPLVALTLLLGQARELEHQRVLGLSLMLAKLQLSVASLQGLTQPLLLLLGVNIALFTNQAAGWTTAIVHERLPRWAAPVLLLLLGWRVHGVVVEAIGRVEGSSLEAELLAYAGALGILLGVGLVWWLVGCGRGLAERALPTTNEVAETVERYGPPIILAYSATALAVMIVVQLAAAVAFTRVMQPVVDLLLAASGVLTAQIATWQEIVAGLALVGAVWSGRRGRRALALYLGIFGVIHLWYELVSRGRPLAVLRWRGPEPVDFWLVTLIAGAALGWLLRGRLTPDRVGRLIFLVLITALLRQTDFIENPFSPFLGFAGIGFIAFSVIWDLLTRGKWANSGTPGLPRLSRILLYVGYALLTVTVINWSLAAHDLATVGKFTGETAVAGFERFGRPMLYAIFAITLALPPADGGAKLSGGTTDAA